MGDVFSGSCSLPSETSYRQTHRCSTFPKALAPALQEHDLGSKLGAPHPCTLLHGSWELSSRWHKASQPGCIPHQGSLCPCSGAGEAEHVRCCHLPASPDAPAPQDGVEHTRRGGSNGYKATTCPKLTPGEPQQGPEPGKSQIACSPQGCAAAFGLGGCSMSLAFSSSHCSGRGGSSSLQHPGLSQHFGRARCSAEISP